ncbi:MAG: hypothetical protein KUG83_06815 [Gammaproteobacteria bacterium]|nr:hypothetical protein [Gammaproteobacteria bacterium]
MRALAEYAMRGRRNAILAALLLGMIPLVSWLSASIVALVTLRKGSAEGLLVALWAVVPAAYLWYMGDGVALPLIMLVFFSSVVLRETVSLMQAMILQQVAVAFVALAVIKFELVPFAQLLDMMKQLAEKIDLEKQLNLPILDAQHFELLVANFYSFSLASTAMLALLVARWWQAVLYNPGGFQQEFHQLKLPAVVAGALVLGLATVSVSSPIASVVTVLIIPLTVAGIALVHGIVKVLAVHRRSLVAFYMASFVLGPYLYLPMVILVLADSFFDFRNRFRKDSQE